ncbi:Fe-S cluster assembly protein SufD [uncultured Gammaproteobacteria bacterium]
MITAAQAFLDQFDHDQSRLPGATLPWLRHARGVARDRFARQGLPTPHLESWKYTPLRLPVFVHAADVPQVIPSPGQPPVQSPEAYACRFINGGLVSWPNDLPDGVTIAALSTHPELAASSLQRDDVRAMAALNGALWRDGLIIRLEPGVVLATPITLTFVTLPGFTAVAWHLRLVIELGDGAKATVVEHHIGQHGSGSAATLANSVADITLGSGAILRHYQSQHAPETAWHIASSTVRVGDCASYEGFLLSCGAGMARDDVQVSLDGGDATCRLAGVTMLRGHRHSDATLAVDHHFARGTSRQVFKSVIDDDGHAVFQGRIVVHPGAIKTDGQQMSRALLLSERAAIDAKPELEIHADDVKCGHGSTVGALDDDALFYLRARGIKLEAARALLIEAFLADALEEISDATVRDQFLAQITHWLADRS